MTILLATNNRHKAEEIREVLSSFQGINVIRPEELDSPIPDPVEDGTTLEENAWIKAKEIHDATGLPVLADDTGLEVEALDGAPGVYSARYSGEEATYESNCRKLLTELEGVAQSDRGARFRTVLCYVDQSRTLFAEGDVQGSILTEPKGESGFGYDPVFRPEGEERSFAEMASEEKNQISHRGRAVMNFREVIRPYLEEWMARSAERSEDDAKREQG